MQEFSTHPMRAKLKSAVKKEDQRANQAGHYAQFTSSLNQPINRFAYFAVRWVSMGGRWATHDH